MLLNKYLLLKKRKKQIINLILNKNKDTNWTLVKLCLYFFYERNSFIGGLYVFKILYR